jgi:flagellar hook-associated protein 1 FlgK
MATTNIFSIGQSALAAAQIAQATTSHNISNATTPGYNRQVVVQSTLGSMKYGYVYGGYGFIGQGTQVTQIKRIYDDFLNKQLLSSQTSVSSLDAYYAQIGQIDDLVADTSAGLSPSLQDFFKSIQNLSATPNNDGVRQSVLSAGQMLASRFQSLNSQLAQHRASLNSQITFGVTTINAYARQIQELNDAVLKTSGPNGVVSNDLLDQRDQVIADLNKIIKVTTLPQDSGALSVFIGTGQPLVLGNVASTLVATPASDDPARLQISYQNNGQNVVIPDSAFTGGSLGGILQYRSDTLDLVQNSLGRIAIAIGMEFNAQHRLGQDQNGNLGTDFFEIATPVIYSDRKNSTTAVATATITDPSRLTTSDYRLTYDGAKYIFLRLSDGNKTVVDPTAPGAFPVTIDGVTYATPTMVAGDSFLIKPTVAGANLINVVITNTQRVAAGIPVLTSINAVTNMGIVTTGNTGSGVVTSATVDKSAFTPDSTQTYTYDAGMLTLTPPAAVTVTTTAGVTTTYAAGAAIPYSTGAVISSGGVRFVLSGTPANGDTYKFSPVPANTGTATISPGKIDSSYTPLAAGTRFAFTFDSANSQFTPSASVGPVVVTHADGSPPTSYAAGAPIDYVAGDTFSTAGASFTITGQPANGDQFYLSPNIGGISDNRNAQALSALQTTNTIGNTSFQGAYSQLVAVIGSKTNEIDVTSKAELARLNSIQEQQQSGSGVNQDEELSNMIKNQTAYQAAAKIIQAASDMLNILLTLGD